MCLAYPMKVVSIAGPRAMAEACGIRREVGIELIKNIAVGDYVMVHAGFAIEKVDTRQAEKTLEVLKEYHEALQENKRQKSNDLRKRAPE